jgi:hypothetical protein
VTCKLEEMRESATSAVVNFLLQPHSGATAAWLNHTHVLMLVCCAFLWCAGAVSAPPPPPPRRDGREWDNNKNKDFHSPVEAAATNDSMVEMVFQAMKREAADADAAAEDRAASRAMRRVSRHGGAGLDCVAQMLGQQQQQQQLSCDEAVQHKGLETRKAHHNVCW